VPSEIQSVQSGEKTLNQLVSEKKIKFDKYIAQAIKSDQSSSSSASQVFKIDKCKIVDPQNKICALCEDRYYRSGSACLIVSDNCKDYDMTNGKCTSCAGSLVLVNGDCVKKQVDPIIQSQSQAQTQTTSQSTPTQGGGAVVISNTQVNTSTQPTSTKPNILTPTTTTDQNCLKW
jgi:hypothetical protein